MLTANICTLLDRGIVLLLLQLQLLEVFTQRNCVADFFDWTWILCTKTTNLLSEPPFGGVRDKTSGVAAWKASGQLHIHDNWTFFARLRRHMQILVEVGIFKEGGSLSTNFRWKWLSPTSLCWCEKNRAIAVSYGIKISAVCSLLLSQNISVTDREMDKQNYDR